MAGNAFSLSEVIDGASGVQKFNAKTLFKGTGTEIGALSGNDGPFAGQLAVCSSTGGGFTADRLYQRNVGNSAWKEVYDLAASKAPDSKLLNGLAEGVTDGVILKIPVGTNGQILSRSSGNVVYSDPPKGGNLLELLTPTITTAGWTTAPGSLGNIHDDNRATATTQGTDTAPPSVETNADCEVKIDLGALYHVSSISIKSLTVRVGGSGGTMEGKARAGPAGDLSDTDIGTIHGSTAASTTKYLFWNKPDVANTLTDPFIRYVTLRVWVAGQVGSPGAGLQIHEVIVEGVKVS